MLVRTGCLSDRLEAEAGVRVHGAVAVATAVGWQGAGPKPPPLAVGKGGHFPLRPSGRTTESSHVAKRSDTPPPRERVGRRLQGGLRAQDVKDIFSRKDAAFPTGRHGIIKPHNRYGFYLHVEVRYNLKQNQMRLVQKSFNFLYFHTLKNETHYTNGFS